MKKHATITFLTFSLILCLSNNKCYGNPYDGIYVPPETGNPIHTINVLNPSPTPMEFDDDDLPPPTQDPIVPPKIIPDINLEDITPPPNTPPLIDPNIINNNTIVPISSPVPNNNGNNFPPGCNYGSNTGGNAINLCNQCILCVKQESQNYYSQLMTLSSQSLSTLVGDCITRAAGKCAAPAGPCNNGTVQTSSQCCTTYGVPKNPYGPNPIHPACN